MADLFLVRGLKIEMVEHFSTREKNHLFCAGVLKTCEALFLPDSTIHKTPESQRWSDTFFIVRDTSFLSPGFMIAGMVSAVIFKRTGIAISIRIQRMETFRMAGTKTPDLPDGYPGECSPPQVITQLMDTIQTVQFQPHFPGQGIPTRKEYCMNVPQTRWRKKNMRNFLLFLNAI